MDITLAIDAMGGDHGPHVTVPAALKALAEDDQLNIVLIGSEDAIQAELKANKATTNSRLRIHHASQVVLMDESPQSAMKNKKDSSMRVAINLTKTGEASACVSAGNTGALMATARFVLKTLPGIERPAIASVLPSEHGPRSRAFRSPQTDHPRQVVVLPQERTRRVSGCSAPLPAARSYPTMR